MTPSPRPAGWPNAERALGAVFFGELLHRILLWLERATNERASERCKRGNYLGKLLIKIFIERALHRPRYIYVNSRGGQSGLERETARQTYAPEPIKFLFPSFSSSTKLFCICTVAASATTLDHAERESGGEKVCQFSRCTSYEKTAAFFH